MRERRFLIGPADLEEGRASIRGDELHHLRRVLRLREGDEVSVFDGRGRGFHGVIESIDAARAVVTLGEAEDSRVEPRVRLSLYQGIPHGDRMDLIVEKATELGAAKVLPILSERSVVKPRSGGWTRLERWRRIAVAAAKQSGRLVVPEIAEPATFEEAIAAASLPATSMRIVFHTSVDAPSRLEEVFRSTAHSEVLVLVGPEGGFTDEEVAAAISTGWRPASLGTRTLRADTAAVAALTLVLALAGEMER